jgi:CheY-like chemotaxis protein
VVDASDAAQAVDRAWHHRPDVLLLDYRMPAGRGTDVLRKLRGIGLLPATIIMTGAENISDVLLRLGFDEAAVLAKPFGLDRLVALVTAAAPARESPSAR